jgi:hypothetical protein
MRAPVDEIQADLERRFPELVVGREKFEKLRAETLQAGDYQGYLLMFDGHKRFPPLLEIEYLLPDKDYWKCLNLVWANIEVSAPDQCEWLRLFKSKRPHREFLMSATERRALAAMPEMLTIYRGYRKGTARRGLSWSLSKDRAWFFAGDDKAERRALLSGYQEGDIPMIVSGRCHKRDVLAYFNGRDEQEIVIDPRNVFAKRSRAVTTS